jgi:UDP-GlcNAc:undecaprenyl-phosphate/decaprenyl-phosphate GlcNAc-1-phosphate transferase
MSNVIGPICAFLLTVMLIAVLRPLARRVGLVDVPNERKHHGVPTPLVGGLAIFVSLVLASLVAARFRVLLPELQVWSFFAGGALLVGVGVVDDFFDLSPAVRFGAQILAALIMALAAGVVLRDLGTMTLGGQVLSLGMLAIPFTVFATLGVINALNMCDGLDGLSGSLALVSLSGLLIAGWLWGDTHDIGMLHLLGGCLAGFLLYNLRFPWRQRASVFMGDAGSMFLGFALTWYAIALSQGDDRIIRPSAALWFLMLPIFDAVSMMMRRVLKGRSPFAADREHLHHVFLLAGFTVNQTVAFMSGVAAIGVVLGLLSIHFRLPELLVAGAFLACGLGYFWLISHAWRVMRFLHRSICRRRISQDRRKAVDPHYAGPERRSGIDRRIRAIESAGVPLVPPRMGMAAMSPVNRSPLR